ncbi:MAG: type II toxin-antitoxin system HicB family antitoxin [Candidatus ainarchaeum sp.]|nr:type II toxin-antitoxin system HicB family antitoxin [Candidatus ainarchaeum sp.]
MKAKTFDVIIERDEDGWFIADVPALHACHTQGKTKKEVLANIKEAIELCLEIEEERENKQKTGFVSVEKVSVYA